MYYKHSGRFSLGGVILGLATGIAGSLLLAYAYAWGIILIPEVHIAVGVTLAFGALVGVAAGYGMVWGKVRNERATLTVAGIVSTLALYMSWAMWIPFVLKEQHVQNLTWANLAQHPREMWELARLINQYGTWGISSGSATSGWALWIIWVLEAAIVIGVAVFLSLGILNHRPFCEACGCWSPRGARVLLAAPQDVAQLKLELEANDLRRLENLEAAAKGADHLIVSLHSCDRCRQFHTMSLTHVTVRRSKTGKLKIENKVIVQHLLIGPGHAETLRQLSDKVKLAAKIAPPKVNSAAAGKK